MRTPATLVLLPLMLALAGCPPANQRKKQIDTPESEAKSTAVVATPVPTAVPTPAKPMDEDRQYTIKGRDTLWDISSSQTAFEDPYYWPALFRANRDVIEDPDLIYVDEQIKIPKGLSEAQLEDARKRAKKAPAYEPHTSPKPPEQLEYLLD